MAQPESSHWYSPKGEPCHWQQKKDGTGQTPTTLAHARKLGLLPSVTGVLKVVDKPALNDYRARMAAIAVLTAPRVPGEELDAFITRVLETESQQDEEAAKARDRGTEIHAAIELVLQGRSVEVDEDLHPWIEPSCRAILGKGRVLETETVLVGDGYAGRADIILQCQGDIEHDVIVDVKTSKTMPQKGSWPEHKLQLAAYAAAYAKRALRPVRTANLYISTVNAGEYAWFDNPAWELDFPAFDCVFSFWTWLKGYDPRSQYEIPSQE